MKIMQVIPYFCFGGAETMCENLTYALKAQGHEVFVASLYDEHTPIARRMEANGVRIVYLDKKPGLDLSMVTKLVALMRREKPDVVHSHLNILKYAALAAKLAGVPHCVHTVHNMADKEAESRTQSILSGFYFTHGWSTPVALSPEVQHSIEEFYHLPRKRVPMVYNGIDLSRCEEKQNYSLGQTITLTHIGRFNEQKNHAGLLRAFAKIHAQYPQSRLNLLGDGELMEPVKELARELGLSDSVHFLGSQSNVYPYLRETDLFLLPSLYEGMPMTLIEAMGTGLPIVASAVGGVPDMLKDGESALLTTCDPGSVADAALRLLADQSLRETLGQNAKRESKRFSADYMAREYVRVYTSEGV